MLKKILALIPILFFSGAAAAELNDISLEHKKDNAAADATEIIGMRSALAKQFIRPGVTINEETFKNVCGAVSRRVKEISEKEGLVIRHASMKNRNPKNAPSPDELELIEKFRQNRKLPDVWDNTVRDGKKYLRYTRPIYVEGACLACHGKKDERPEFIVDKYPDDKAFDFSVGDLRGIISVLIPLD
ncbi:MAG: DUF3365 domain-containing protein [Deltaproteobacteria bacterium]|nr:DUF3365 domain-containing protein [Deltaproteobacteria bacterium]